MNDEEAVDIHIDAREAADDGEISDACARVIASWYSEGEGTAGYEFASTGAITSATLYRELTRMGSGRSLYERASPNRKRALDWLGTYLANRADKGPVPGWSDIWIRP